MRESSIYSIVFCEWEFFFLFLLSWILILGVRRSKRKRSDVFKGGRFLFDFVWD